MRVVLWIMFAFSLVLATDLKLKLRLRTPAPVYDLAYHDHTLYACDAQGHIFAFSPTGKKIKSWQLPKRVDFYGEKNFQKAMTLTLSPSGKTIAVAGEDGRVYLIRNHQPTPTHFFTSSVIRRLAFVDENLLLVATISHEVSLIDLATQKTVKTTYLNTSPLSDMAISRERDLAATAGEAGIVILFNPRTLAIVGKLQGGNVDNIYKIDMQAKYIVTAGQDRRVILYRPNRTYSRYDGSFLVYAAALSPDAKYIIAALDEENRLYLIDTASGKHITKKEGHSATLNRILFLDHHHIASCADENSILLWEIQ